jgi:hypothetical protein
MARLTGLSAKIMVQQYKDAFQKKGYAFFENGDYVRCLPCDH